MTIVALYACVSAKDKGQRTENQLPELQRFAQNYKNTLIAVEFDAGPKIKSTGQSVTLSYKR